MTNLRNLVKGWDCMVRLAGICNFNPETTVGAHFRLIGVSGLAMKSPDILIAAACSDCHAYCDTHHDDATQLALAKGVMRTLVRLAKEGMVTW